MARVIIREQDLTGNTIDQDFTDIAFVPGFVKYPKEEFMSPQLCIGEVDFQEKFGNEPALAFSNFSYNVVHKAGEVTSTVLNPDTGNNIFYLGSNDVETLSDCAYHYARELLYRGLPVIYCPINKEVYDGNQGVSESKDFEVTVPSDDLPSQIDLTRANPTDPDLSYYANSEKNVAFSLSIQNLSTNEIAEYMWYVDNVLVSIDAPTSSQSSSTYTFNVANSCNVYCKATIKDETTKAVKGHVQSKTCTISMVRNSAELIILPQGSTEERVLSTQPASEKFELKQPDPYITTDPPNENCNANFESGVQNQKVGSNEQVTFTAQVKGLNVERFVYFWYIEGTANDGEVLKKQLVSTAQILKLNSGKFKSGTYTISVTIMATPASSYTLNPITIEDNGEILSVKKIIDLAKAKAIDIAMGLINRQFAQEMIDFFLDQSNTELIKDRGLYNFKYLTTGGYPLFEAAVINNGSDGTTTPLAHWHKALQNLLAVAGQKTVDDSKDYIAEDGSTQRQGRGDCVLLIDHSYDKQQDTMDLYARVREYFEDSGNVNKETLEFAAMFTPWCNYSLTYTTKSVNINFPASFAYLSCLADSIQAYDNWNAIAGVTRGTVKHINEVLLTNPLTNTKANKCQADPDTAETGRVSINCITEIKPYGQVIWGNRTLQRADGYKHVTAMGFLNLRNEVSDIKKLVYRAARRWMFEQNTSILWINFKSTITPLLERMVNGYGLSRYEIRRGEKTAKHKLYAEIRIWPIYAVEYIDVTIQILDEETIVTEE